MHDRSLKELHHLVEQVHLLTSVPLPEMLEPDAPVLSDDSLGNHGHDFYLIGIIGGKNVGKSALVNAIVGEEITQRSSTGCGTEQVVAYLHSSQQKAVSELLDREAPGQYEIVTHQRPDLRRQVLLDLPDFDSHYSDHFELTRRMLRQMLYPIWLQSIEKYADGQPRELLRRVVAGNDPRNLTFCLNKIDQVEAAGQMSAAQEIRADYAERLEKTLGLEAPPRVWLVERGTPSVTSCRSCARPWHASGMKNRCSNRGMGGRASGALAPELGRRAAAARDARACPAARSAGQGGTRVARLRADPRACRAGARLRSGMGQRGRG